jgi:hypothetical protein
MTIQHKNIADADLHEPKGISSATVDKVYVSNGLGSGSWQVVPGRAHADMYIDAGATTQTLSASQVYAKLNPGTEWTSGVSNILTISPSTGEITLSQAGNYLINFWVTFTTTALAAGTGYRFKFALDGTTSTRTLEAHKPTNGADVVTCSATGLVTATAGQKLTMYCAGDATSSGANITVTEAGLTAVKL